MGETTVDGPPRVRGVQETLGRLARSEALSAGDVGAAVRAISETASVALAVAHVAVWQVEADGAGLTCLNRYDRETRSHHLGRARVPADLPVCLETLSGETLLAVTNVRSDPRTSRLAPEHLTPFGVSALLGAPVHVGGRLAALICYEHVGAPRRWTRDEQTFAASMAQFVALAMEISRRVGVEREQAKRATALMDTADSVLITDVGGVIEYVNPAFERASGFTAGEVVGRRPNFLRSGHHPDAFYAEMWRTLLAGDVFRGVFVNRRKGGRIYHEEKTITPVTGVGGHITHFISTGRDITARRLAEARIRHLATHDPLTGLPNRLRFAKQLERAVFQAGRDRTTLAVLFVGLDRFKRINDILGHSVGDRLLKKLAVRLSRTLAAPGRDPGENPAEVLLARFGGDEFNVLLGGLPTADTAEAMARRLSLALARPFRVDGHELVLTSSIGLAHYPRDAGDADGLLRRADTALREAKRQGPNLCVPYSPPMSGGAHRRLTLEGRLRHAVEAGEMEVYYQPKLGAADGRVTGAEALLRWHHPELGLLLPGEFIPLAEETGQIVPIGLWVLRAACAQARAWLDAGLSPVTVAVNVSARQLRYGNIVGQVRQALRDTRLPPSALDLEITEGTLMQQGSGAAPILRRLKRLGVTLSIDDFGTGYSSLSYLRRFSVDQLKIDRTFVSGLPRRRKDASITRAIITLGHALGLRVVAEGVERDSQLAFLKRHGADQVQGFLIGAPMPADRFAALMAGREPFPPAPTPAGGPGVRPACTLSDTPDR